MIYLHHCPLSQLLPEHQLRLSPDDRQTIRHYQQQQLNQFCTTHHLPMPMLERQAHGKPFCSNLPHLAFNHSHSQQHYALVYSLDVADLGVDIEDLQRNVRMQKLAEHSFHADELAYWQQHNQERAIWFKIWTIKESVLKAHGLGIRLNLKELNTQINDDEHGFVIHPTLGKFYYQSIQTEQCMIAIAYRWQGQYVPIQALG